jgi:lipopolysaccharide transport system permease protein
MNIRSNYIYGLPSNSGFLGPIGIFSSSWAHRDLIFRLARREVQARYKGSMLGLVWSVLMPLALLGVYTFVFSKLFHARWDLPDAHRNKFFLIVFSGMIVANLFCSCVGRSPTLMLSNVNYIKKVLFPLEILSLVVLVSEGFDALMSSLVLAIGYLYFIGLPPITALFIPVILLPYLVLIIGAVWFLSALGVYLRDLRQLVAVVLGVIGLLNPLTAILEQVRQVLFFGNFPDWRVYFVYLLFAWAFAWLGRIWFTHAQRGFADVV